MLNRWFHTPSLHVPRPGHSRRVGWLELFYDLIYVAALIQLGNALSSHVGWGGFLAFSAIFVPIWLGWTAFTFYSNRFVVDDFAHRSLVFVQMGGVAGVAVSVPSVLEHEPVAFGASIAIVRWAMVLMYARTWWQTPEAREMTGRYTLGFAGGAALWTLSVFLPTPWVYAVWTLAVVVDLYTPLGSTTRTISEKYPPDVLHMTERYGLLTLIVLGESFVKVLSTLAEQGGTADSALMAVVGVGITFSVWWIYFDDIAGSRIRPLRLAAYTWVYSHLPLTLGITGLGVAVKKFATLDPMEPAADKYRWLLCGTLAILLLSASVIDSITERRQAELSDKARVKARLAGFALVILAGAAGGRVPAGIFVTIITALFVLQVFFDLVIAPMVDPEAAHHEDPGMLRTVPTPTLGPKPAPRWDVGDAVRLGTPSDMRRDLYVTLMDWSWTQVFVTVWIVFFGINAVFAGLYLLDDQAVGGGTGSFVDAYWFSVQTIATIGYGALTPATNYANVVVAVEAFIGILGTAVVTGLVFAKASRPRASVLWSKAAVITVRNGQPTLMLRLGNARGNDVTDAEITVTALVEEVSSEGHSMRRLVDVELLRSRTPLFALSFTAMHVIDERSPLYCLLEDHESPKFMGLICILTGHDSTFATTVHSRTRYFRDQVRFSHRYVDVISTLPDGRLQVDYAKFDDTEPDDSPTA